jgi:mannosyltransferase
VIRKIQPHQIVLAAVLLLAAVIRFYNIGMQSLWYDEGNSARIAERSLQLIMEGAGGDIHPPLYYVVLKFWRAFFGDREAVLRGLSAICNIATIGLTYVIGRDMASRRIGLIAAFLTALAPFAVYYSQEARMYAPLALCAATSTLAQARFLKTPSLRAGSAYALATAAGLWTHYAYPFVMLAQGAWALTALFQSRHDAAARVRLAGYSIMNIAALMVFAPWLPVALRQIRGWSVDAQPYALPAAAIDAFRWLVAGRTLETPPAIPLMILIGALALCGIASRKISPINRLALIALSFAPLGLLFVFGLYREAYLKFLLVSVCPLLLLTAIGIDWLADQTARCKPKLALPAALTLCTGIAALFLPALQNLYNNPVYARDDYRGIYNEIQNSNPDAQVIFNAPNQWEVFTYYQKSERNLHPLQYRPGSDGEVAQQMEQIVFGQLDLFTLYFAEREADPNGWYERWLALNAYKISERWVGNIRLARYAGTAKLETIATKVAFGAEITAERVEADLSRADGVIPIRITWRANRALDRKYKIFVHIGVDNAPPIAQSDSEPASGQLPTDAWPANAPIQDLRGVAAPPGALATQHIYLGVYDANSGERVGERVKVR